MEVVLVDVVTMVVEVMGVVEVLLVLVDATYRW